MRTIVDDRAGQSKPASARPRSDRPPGAALDALGRSAAPFERRESRGKADGERGNRGDRVRRADRIRRRLPAGAGGARRDRHRPHPAARGRRLPVHGCGACRHPQAARHLQRRHSGHRPLRRGLRPHAGPRQPARGDRDQRRRHRQPAGDRPPARRPPRVLLVDIGLRRHRHGPRSRAGGRAARRQRHLRRHQGLRRYPHPRLRGPDRPRRRRAALLLGLRTPPPHPLRGARDDQGRAGRPRHPAAVRPRLHPPVRLHRRRGKRRDRGARRRRTSGRSAPSTSPAASNWSSAKSWTP